MTAQQTNQAQTNSIDSLDEFYFDESYALKFKDFYESFCVITERCLGGDVGAPLKMIPWQYTDIIKPLYGWRRKSDDSRRYTHCGIWIPKKQNKSGLIAAIALYHIIVEEPAASAYVIASKIEQAKIVFNFAANTCRYGKLNNYVGKSKQMWLRDTNNTIEWTSKQAIKGKLRVMPTTPEGISGPSASLVLY